MIVCSRLIETFSGIIQKLGWRRKCLCHQSSLPLVSNFSHFFLAPVMKLANLLYQKVCQFFSHVSQFLFNLGCIIIASSVNGEETTEQPAETDATGKEIS